MAKKKTAKKKAGKKHAKKKATRKVKRSGDQNEINTTSVPILDVIPYARNPRKNDAAVAKVALSLGEFGWRQPIVVDSEMVVIAGHTRLKAAHLLGMTEVPIHIAEGLTPEQVKAYRLMDNRSGEDAEYDMDLLEIELGDLKADDFDMALTGFDGDELANILADAAKDGLTDEDSAPEPPKDPTTKLGDLWLLGEHRLLCGDSTDIGQVERLMDGVKADLVFTDPPYGVDYDGGHAVDGVRREKLRNDKNQDLYADVLPVIFLFSNDSAALYLWYAGNKTPAVWDAVIGSGYEVRNLLIWNKNMAQFGAIGAQYKAKHEPFLYCFKKGKAPKWTGPNNEVTVWDVSRAAKNEFHPTQKPVELCSRAMANSSLPGAVVLDLFGGSGSTLIACEKYHRQARIAELAPEYCDVIIQRWEEYTGKKATLSADG